MAQGARRGVRMGGKVQGGSKPSGRTRSLPKPGVALIDRSNPGRHLEERQRLLYGIKHGKCYVDYASKEAAATWPHYVILPNGEQGPAPFRDVAEMREYERRYKFRSE